MPTAAAGVQVSVSGTFTTLLAGFVGQSSIPVSANSQARLVPMQPTSVANLVPLAVPFLNYQSGGSYDLYVSMIFLDLTSPTPAPSVAWPAYGDAYHNFQYWSDGSHPSGQLAFNSTVPLVPAVPGYIYNIQAGLQDNATRQVPPIDPVYVTFVVSPPPYILVTLPVCNPCSPSPAKIVGFARFRIKKSDITLTVPPTPPASLMGTFVPFVTNPLTPFSRATGPASGTVAVALTN